MTQNRWLTLILAGFTLLGVLYALVTPVFEASDELWHYPMVRHLADGNPLPVQVFDPDQAGPWKQEASQPPLYYYLGAAFTFWIDTSDMEQVRWLNPHVDNGVITEDGNINLVIHDPATDLWQGTSLAIRVVRLASVLLGTVTVYLTYAIAREVSPGRPELYLGAAAINAFIPMFLFISAAVNNDNLVVPLASLSLLLIIRVGKANQTAGGTRREILRLLLIGAVIGLGSLTKISALGLVPLALLGIGIGQWRRFDETTNSHKYWRLIWDSFWRWLVVLAPALLIAGWWYIRNIQLYGDWSGWNAFIAVLGQRSTPASLAQLWDESWGFMLSYWGLFGGLNVPMSEWIYRLLNILLVISLVGFMVYSVGLIRNWWSERRRHGRGIEAVVKTILDFVADNFALIACILWALAVIVGLIRWAMVTWSSQGRLVFSAISALSTLFVIGLVGWLPRNPAKIGVSTLATFMLTISILAPFLWIKPAYEVVEADSPDLRIVGEQFGEALQLQGYAIGNESVRPGDMMEIFLRWEILERMDRDWSIFVHLNDPLIDLPVAQRDMYPGQGLLSTRLLEPGQQISDRYLLKVPDTAIAPANLELTIGLYDYFSGERLSTGGGADSIALSSVGLLAHPGEVPNPMSINFEDAFELLGFSVEPRSLEPSEVIELTLYWRSKAVANEDFTFFAQLVDQDTTRWASHDLLQPTSEWQTGDMQRVALSLPLIEETPAGTYPIIVGLYTRSADGGFDRLQRVTAEGRLTDDFLELTRIRVD